MINNFFRVSHNLPIFLFFDIALIISVPPTE